MSRKKKRRVVYLDGKGDAITDPAQWHRASGVSMHEDDKPRHVKVVAKAEEESGESHGRNGV
jgi:hypothetical protein